MNNPDFGIASPQPNDCMSQPSLWPLVRVQFFSEWLWAYMSQSFLEMSTCQSNYDIIIYYRFDASLLMFTYIYIYVYFYIYMYVCILIYTCIYIYIHIYTRVFLYNIYICVSINYMIHMLPIYIHIYFRLRLDTYIWVCGSRFSGLWLLCLTEDGVATNRPTNTLLKTPKPYWSNFRFGFIVVKV